MPNEPKVPVPDGDTVEHDATWPDRDNGTPGGPSMTEAAPSVIQMDQSSAGEIRAQTVHMNQSAAGSVMGSTIHLQQGASGFVRGTTVEVQEGVVGAVAADQVEFRDGFALLIVARRVSGQTTVLLDWRAVTGAVAVLVVLGRLLRGRR